LLALRREIRDQIYVYLAVTKNVTSRKASVQGQPWLKVHTTASLSVLLINKQLHVEYQEHISKNTTLIVLYRQDKCPQSPVRIHEGVPTTLLRRIKHCDIVASPHHLAMTRLTSNERLRTVKLGFNQEGLGQSPSKGMYLLTE
jgi:hypothetical protein